MKIKLIDFGLKKDHYPFRPHENDAGADVYMPYDYTLKPGEIVRIPLGFGLMILMVLPDTYFREAAWQQKGWSANFRLLILDIVEKFMPSSVMLVQNPKYSAKIPV